MRNISKISCLVLVVMLCAVAVALAAPDSNDCQENAEARTFEQGIEEYDAEETSSSTTIHLVSDPQQIDGTSYAYVSRGPTEAVNEAEGGMAAGGAGILFLALLVGAILTMFLIHFKVRNSKFNKRQGLVLTTLMMLCALAVFSVGQVEGSTTVTYRAIDEAHVSQDNPSTNYGSEEWAQVCGDVAPGVMRLFLKFDYSSIPSGVIIDSATVQLWSDGNEWGTGTFPIDINPITDDTWSEGIIDWTTGTSLPMGTTLDTQPGPMDPEWTTWTVTSFVQTEYTNDGIVSFCVMLDNEADTNGTNYATDEVPASTIRPLLSITYHGPSSGSIIYVDQDATGLNDGTSWADAFTDLQDALGTAAASDEIWVAEGTYKPTTGSDRAATFQLLTDVALFGGFKGTEIAHDQRDWEIYETILSGDIGIVADSTDNSYHVTKGADNATIDGFTITRGRADGIDSDRLGGGMYNSEVSIILANCIFISNSSDSNGAGMFNHNSYIEVTNCTFEGNLSKGNGGAVANWNSTNDIYSFTATNSIFTFNTAWGYGGGMHSIKYTISTTDCSFTYNAALGNGGGMANDGSALVATNCIFSNNECDESGGGIYNYHTSLNITNCLFSQNWAMVGYGGGMCNDGFFTSSSSMFDEVIDCTFSGNIAYFCGGGMYNAEYSPQVKKCIFTGNYTENSGGGMYNDSSDPFVINCIFNENSVCANGGLGGGMFNNNSDPELINCIFIGNSVTDYDEFTYTGGGGMYNTSSSPTLTSCTFTGNYADLGGAIYSYESTLSVNNSIFWADSAEPSGGPEFDYFSSTLNVHYCCVEGGYAGTGNIDIDPLFVDMADADGPDDIYRTVDDGLCLQSGSPCIDTGSSGVFPYDILIVSRPQGAGFDMGAYEYTTPNSQPFLTYAVNSPPIVIDGSGTLLMNAGTTLTITVTGSDPDNDPITLDAYFGAQPLPAGATWTFPQGPSTPNIGVFEWTPTSAQVGVWGPGGSAGLPLTLRVDDGDLFDTHDVTISIGPSTNVAPTLELYEAGTNNPISFVTIKVGQTFVLDLYSSDPNPPDEIIITYSLANPIPGGATLAGGGVGHANPVLYNFAWTPATGYEGQHDIEFIARDNGSPVLETSRMFTIFVESLNNPPVADAKGPYSGDEGSTITFDASGSTDPEGDLLQYRWDFDNDGIWDTSWSSDPTATFTYGDDYNDVAVLEVSDGEYSDTGTADVTISDLDPTVTVEDVILNVEIGLRVAGRKYNDVGMTLFEDGVPMGYLSVERTPGGPDDQMVWMPVSLDFSKSYSATATYLPEDPPNIGSNPVWIDIRFEDGSIAEAHHTFNVQQSMIRDSGHWNHIEPWEVDIKNILIGHAVPITATAMDPGSDDLGFSWSFLMDPVWYNNDGSTGTLPTDPYPSPGGIFPFTATDTSYFTYNGPETIDLTVTNDDGGSVSTTLYIG